MVFLFFVFVSRCIVGFFCSRVSVVVVFLVRIMVSI